MEPTQLGSWKDFGQDLISLHKRRNVAQRDQRKRNGRPDTFSLLNNIDQKYIADII